MSNGAASQTVTLQVKGAGWVTAKRTPGMSLGAFVREYQVTHKCIVTMANANGK